LKISSLISAVGIVAIGMIAGRLLGLLREIGIASYFGADKQADAAILLLLIPDFITAVFIGSAVSAAIIPAFSERSEQRSLALFWQTMLVAVFAFIVISLVISFLDTPDNFKTPLFLTLCSLPFAAATAVFMAWLQYSKRFFAPAFATAIFNLAILCTLWFAPTGLEVLAIGIIVATLLRLLAHIISFMRGGGKLKFSKIFQWEKSGWEIDKKLTTTYMQTATAGVLGMLPLYAPYLIIAVTTGGLALFNYAFKLVLLPAILLQTIIQTVVLPLFVRQHKDDTAEMRARAYSASLYSGFIFGVSIALAVTLAAEPIVTLCFAYGKISAQNVTEIANLLMIGIWATPFSILSCLWQQILYAGSKAKISMMASFSEAALLFPLYYFGQNIWGQEGVMVAYLIIRIFHFVIIARLGKQCIALSSFIPNKDYIFSTIAMLSVFAILASLYLLIFPASYSADIIKTLSAILIGGASFGAGIFSTKKIRAVILPAPKGIV
jgi:putative peptidoglycan lipid II flippase